MTDTEKIAALAAELTRIGKIGAWKNVCGWTFDSYAVPEKVVLAALCGVAAEVCEDSHLVIVRCVAERVTTWEVWQFDHDGSYFIDQFETRHDALIAALKQVEGG